MKASKQAWSFAVVAALSLGLGPAGAAEPKFHSEVPSG